MNDTPQQIPGQQTTPQEPVTPPTQPQPVEPKPSDLPPVESKKSKFSTISILIIIIAVSAYIALASQSNLWPFSSDMMVEAPTFTPREIGIQYTNTDYNFSLTLPSLWRNVDYKVTVTTPDKEKGAEAEVVFFLPLTEPVNDSSDWYVFSITIWTPGEWNQFRKDFNLPTLGEGNDYVYTLNSPTNFETPEPQEITDFLDQSGFSLDEIQKSFVINET